MSLKSKSRSFVVQEHLAKKAGKHYDLRLEVPAGRKSVYVSWTIRKGMSLDPDIKRLAIETNPHSMNYGKFEGIIADGQYGAGKVIVWDNGSYRITRPTIKNVNDLKETHIFEFELEGKKLKGSFIMIKTKQGWVLQKRKDQFVNNEDLAQTRPESVISGKKVEEITKEYGMIEKVAEGSGL